MKSIELLKVYFGNEFLEKGSSFWKKNSLLYFHEKIKFLKDKLVVEFLCDAWDF